MRVRRSGGRTGGDCSFALSFAGRPLFKSLSLRNGSALFLGDGETLLLGDGETLLFGDGETLLLGDGETLLLGDGETLLFGDGEILLFGDGECFRRGGDETLRFGDNERRLLKGGGGDADNDLAGDGEGFLGGALAIGTSRFRGGDRSREKRSRIALRGAIRGGGDRRGGGDFPLL